MALARVEGRLWVTGGGDGAVPDGRILGIDPDSGEVVQRIRVPNRSPYGIDAGQKGIFAALFQGELLRIHPGGDATSRIPLGDGLTQVLVAHDVVWVSQPSRGNVLQVDVRADDTNAARVELRLEADRSCPQGLDSSEVAIWVADPCAGKAWLLDPDSGEVTGMIEGVGKKPIDVDVTGNLAWIVSARDRLISVVNTERLEVVAQSEAGEGASAVAAHGREAWVANSEGSSLTYLELWGPLGPVHQYKSPAAVRPADTCDAQE